MACSAVRGQTALRSRLRFADRRTAGTQPCETKFHNEYNILLCLSYFEWLN